ncbi:MAG: hypothetical protein U1E38_08500 [Rhodospirillales bacterium]
MLRQQSGNHSKAVTEARDAFRDQQRPREAHGDAEVFGAGKQLSCQADHRRPVRRLGPGDGSADHLLGGACGGPLELAERGVVFEIIAARRPVRNRSNHGFDVQPTHAPPTEAASP